MSDNNHTHSIADYLAQLLKDRKQLAAFPSVFVHVERLLDEEISKVRGNLFQINGGVKEPLTLPEPTGETVSLSEKVYVPVKEYPDFNFVGRILGPRGMTAKQLEQETCCKIMVRGKGSMRDKFKEDQNRGKPNWEHLNDELHVLISVEDTENRAKLKLQRATEEIKKLLVPSVGNDGEDELKKRQLMELAIINGTYRDSSSRGIMMPQDFEALGALAGDIPRLLASGALIHAPMRTGTPLGGHPLIMPARVPMPTSGPTLMNGNTLQQQTMGMMPPLVPVSEAGGLIYSHYAPASAADYAQLTNPILQEYHHDPTGQVAAAAAAAAAAGGKHRNPRHYPTQGGRDHPYHRS